MNKIIIQANDDVSKKNPKKLQEKWKEGGKEKGQK